MINFSLHIMIVQAPNYVIFQPTWAAQEFMGLSIIMQTNFITGKHDLLHNSVHHRGGSIVLIE